MDMESLRRDTSIEFEITDGHGILTKGHVNRIRDNRWTWNTLRRGTSIEFEITDGHGIFTKGYVNRIRDNRWTWNHYEGARQ